MTDRHAALALAEAVLQRTGRGDDFAINEPATIERPFGWVFFWNRREFLATRDFRQMALGNGPIFVDRADGSVHFGSPSLPVEELIARYENWRSGAPARRPRRRPRGS